MNNCIWTSVPDVDGGFACIDTSDESTIKEKLQMPGWKSFIRDCVLTQAENLNLVRICYYGGEIKTLTNNHSVHSSYTSNGLRTENNECSDQFVLGLISRFCKHIR